MQTQLTKHMIKKEGIQLCCNKYHFHSTTTYKGPQNHTYMYLTQACLGVMASSVILT